MTAAGLNGNSRESNLLSASQQGFRPAAFRRYIESLVKVARSDPPAVIESVNRILALARGFADRKSLGSLYRTRAHALRAANRPDRARADYERAITLFRGSGHSDEVAITRIGLIDAHMYLGRYEEARRTALEARRFFRKAGDLVRGARVETNLGNILHRLDEPRKALAHYDAARRVFLRHQDAQGLALVDFNRGNVLSLLGRTRAARTAYGLSAGHFRRIGFAAQSAQVDYNAAYLSFLENRLPQSLEELEVVRPLFEKLGDERHLALTRLDESEILLRLHLWTDAGMLAREARDRFHQLRMTYEEAKAGAFLGLALARQNDRSGATRELKASLRSFRREGNRAWQAETALLLGSIALDQGKWTEARRWAAEVLKREDRFDQPGLAASAWLLEARSRRGEGATARARAATRNALERSRAARSPWLEGEARELAGVLALEQGDLGEARRHLRRSIAVTEGLRARLTGDDLKAGFLRDRDRPYVELAALEMKRGRPRKAFEILERGRSRALLDLLAAGPRRGGRERAVARLAEKLLDELGRHYHRKLLAETGNARWTSPAGVTDEERVTRIETRAAALLRRLDRTHGVRAGTADLGAVQRILSEDETLLVYYELGGSLGVFEVGRDRFSVHPAIASVQEIERDVQSLRFQWGRFRWDAELLKRHAARLDEMVKSDLGRLYQKLLGWESPERPAGPLLVVPTGSLRSVPFAALHDGTRYLAERRCVAVVPSATVLARLRDTGERSVVGGRMVLVGVADVRAPEVDREIADLARLFPAARVLTGKGATAGALRREAAGARLVHLATHGLFRTDRPQFSGLRLADRWIYGCDLGRWPIRSELVTLSACVTGLSEAWGTGEWMGLSRALLSAGARRVLVGLWDVDDAATRQLMRHFYQSLLSTDRPRPAEALARAQAGMAASGWHPYYWSGFSLIGDL